MRQKVTVLAPSSSRARRTGIRQGDEIIRVNGRQVEDELDFRFLLPTGRVNLEILTPGKAGARILRLRAEDARTLSFEPMRIRRCRNHCLFCFVDQLPRGLRKSLYLKDEDYRFSFLYGNYVTLSCLSNHELSRILRQRLSPLYVSVHATDPQVRNVLLGRKRSRDIMETLSLLARGGITLHTQVVLCPGINDGEILRQTVLELASLFPEVASIAVVPVGLTRYRKSRGAKLLRAVTSKYASNIILEINDLQSLLKAKYGKNFVHLSDEFYLKSNTSFPAHREYGDFPQWQNGVGMIPLFYREWERRKRQHRQSRRLSPCRVLAATGELPYPRLLPYTEWISGAAGISVELVPIRNSFFGRHVTVAGLVTGQDLMWRLKGATDQLDAVLVPDVMLSRSGKRFLDDVSLSEIETRLNVPVLEFRPDPAGFEEVLQNVAARRNKI